MQIQHPVNLHTSTKPSPYHARKIAVFSTEVVLK